jgi:hypothetical protein
MGENMANEADSVFESMLEAVALMEDQEQAEAAVRARTAVNCYQDEAVLERGQYFRWNKSRLCILMLRGYVYVVVSDIKAF